MDKVSAAARALSLVVCRVLRVVVVVVVPYRLVLRGLLFLARGLYVAQRMRYRDVLDGRAGWRKLAHDVV